jgi:hypothetical protein
MWWDINKPLSGGGHMKLRIGISGIKAMIDRVWLTLKKSTLSKGDECQLT